MEKCTVKEYARRQKISIFQVIRKINRGELKAESVVENGMKVQYVLLETPLSKTERHSEESSRSRSSEGKEGVEEEIARLREKLDRLERIVEKCCGERSDS